MVSARHVGGAIPPQGYLVRQMGGGGESKVWCLLDMSVEQYHHRATWYVRWGGGGESKVWCLLDMSVEQYHHRATWYVRWGGGGVRARYGVC